MGRQNLWIFCGWLSAPRLAWLVHRHHGSRRLRVSRVGSSVAGSVCEYTAGTRTEQRGRVRPWRLPVPHGTPSCGAWHASHCTPPPTRPSASLVWAASSRLASASTLRALERYNEGVCDGSVSCTVHHELPVAAAWCVRQHSGAQYSVRIARAGGIDAVSSREWCEHTTVVSLCPFWSVPRYNCIKFKF